MGRKARKPKEGRNLRKEKPKKGRKGRILTKVITQKERKRKEFLRKERKVPLFFSKEEFRQPLVWEI